MATYSYNKVVTPALLDSEIKQVSWSTPYEGLIYMTNTNDITVYFTGSLTPSEITDLDNIIIDHNVGTLSPTTYFDADLPIDMGLNQIKNMQDPTLAQDAATKKYVDDSVASDVVLGYLEQAHVDQVGILSNSSITTNATAVTINFNVADLDHVYRIDGIARAATSKNDKTYEVTFKLDGTIKKAYKSERNSSKDLNLINAFFIASNLSVGSHTATIEFKPLENDTVLSVDQSTINVLRVK